MGLKNLERKPGDKENPTTMHFQANVNKSVMNGWWCAICFGKFGSVGLFVPFLFNPSLFRAIKLGLCNKI